MSSCVSPAGMLSGKCQTAFELVVDRPTARESTLTCLGPYSRLRLEMRRSLPEAQSNWWCLTKRSVARDVGPVGPATLIATSANCRQSYENPIAQLRLG